MRHRSSDQSGAEAAFRFEREVGRSSFIDTENGLRLRLYQWPEYSFSLAVQPTTGPQAEAWPLSERAYFNFLLGSDLSEKPGVLRIDAAFPYVPFDPAYPGRTKELLDIVIAIIPEVSSELCDLLPRVSAPIPGAMRSLLLEQKSYLRSMHETT